VHAAAAPTPTVPAQVAQAAQPIQPAQAPQAPAANPAPAAPERTVTVVIRTTPSDAQLFLDNAPIANPFDGELPSSSETHRLEARHAGYRSYVQDLSLMYGQRVSISMHHGDGTEDHRRAPTATPNAVAGANAPAAAANGHAQAAAHAPVAAAPQEAPAEHPASVVVPPAQTELRHRQF
jgi:hypothetical protein